MQKLLTQKDKPAEQNLIIQAAYSLCAGFLDPSLIKKVQYSRLVVKLSLHRYRVNTSSNPQLGLNWLGLDSEHQFRRGGLILSVLRVCCVMQAMMLHSDRKIGVHCVLQTWFWVELLATDKNAVRCQFHQAAEDLLCCAGALMSDIHVSLCCWRIYLCMWVCQPGTICMTLFTECGKKTPNTHS